MKPRPASTAFALLLLLAACTPEAGSNAGGIATGSMVTVMPAGTSVPGVIGATAPPIPTLELPTPLATLASALSPTELKYRVLAQYPDFFFCDPDYYPVARADEGDLARQRFPQLQENQEEFQAILAHNGLSGLTSFSDDQKLLIYRDHKKLAALQFELAGDQYQFQLTTGGQSKQSVDIQGVIDGTGRITVQQTTPGFASCPICLAAHTRIDTPGGAVFVEDIRVGEPVWTLNLSGERVSAPVLKVARVPVSAGHVVVHVVLDDGRELWASPGHPTADGRRLVQLRAGDLLDGARISLAEDVAYEGPATYDLLPAGGTGSYWADGILMGSTLQP